MDVRWCRVQHQNTTDVDSSGNPIVNVIIKNQRRSQAFLRRQSFVQLVGKLPTFCRTWRFIPSSQQSVTEPTLSQIHFIEKQASASHMKQISNYISLYRLLLSPLQNLPTTNVSKRLQNLSPINLCSLLSSYNIKLQSDIEIRGLEL